MVAMGSPRYTRSLVSTIHAVSLCRRLGLLSCLSTWPHELADMTGTRPQVVTMSLNAVPPVDCKCAAAAAGPSSRLARSDRFVRLLCTPNCKANSQAQAQPITLSPKALVRAPSEQSKVYERLEESVAKKVNLCAAAASIITGASRYFALSSSLDCRGPRFEDAGLRSNGGGKLVQRGDRRRG